SFSHTFPDDVGIVLVGPTGAALLIQDGAGDDPDMVNVTYTLSDSGATMLPGATAWTAGTYKPTSFFTGDNFPAPGPGTTYNIPGPVAGGTATFQSTFAGTNPNGVWHLYVADFTGGDSGAISGGWSLTINAGPTIIPQHVVDFDGDGKTDPAVVRAPGSDDIWYIQQSTAGAKTQQWGLVTDYVVPEDYDGDGKTDIAVWRGAAPANSYFYILQSATNTLATNQFGQNGDDPRVVGDYDGDNKADVAVYRAGVGAGAHSFWYYRSSINGLIIGTEWGQNGDTPAPGDYDGDGRNDYVVRRPEGGGQAIFYFKNTTSGQSSTIFGIHSPTDVIVPGDYDGDQKTDLAVARYSGGVVTWYILNSSNATTSSFVFGASATDLTAQGDYDGDGKTDVAVWRDGTPGIFYWRRSSDGVTGSLTFGTTGDFPAARYNSH
ncbi:MAG TPA: VCBS repeat-containing protein, partial [Pyrinomonadaceae bacterium]